MKASKKSTPALTLSVEKTDFDRIVSSTKGEWTYSYSTRYRDKSDLPTYLADAKVMKQPITVSLTQVGSRERMTIHGYVTQYTTMIEDDGIKLVLGLSGQIRPPKTRVWGRMKK